MRDPQRAPFPDEFTAENINVLNSLNGLLDSQTGELVFGSDSGDVRIGGGTQKQVTTEDYQNPSPDTPDWTASIVGGTGTAPDPDTDLQESGGNLELTIPDSGTFYRYRRAYDRINYNYGKIEFSIEVPSNYVTGVDIIDSQGTVIDRLQLDAGGDSFFIQSDGNATGSFPIDGTVDVTIEADSSQLKVRVQQSSSGFDQTLTTSRASDTGNDIFFSFIAGIQSGSISTQTITPVKITSTSVLSQIETSQINFDFSKVPEVDIADNDGNTVTTIGGFDTFSQLTFGPAIDLNDQGSSNYEAQINGSNLPVTYNLNNADELRFTGLSNDLNLQGVAEFIRPRYIDWSDESPADYTVTEVDKNVSFGNSLEMEGPGLGTVQRNDGQNPRPDEDWRLVFSAQGEEASPADIAIGLDNVTDDFSQGDADVSVVYDVTNEQLEVNTNVETQTSAFPKSEVLGGQDIEIEYSVSGSNIEVTIQNTVSGNSTIVGAQIDSGQFTAPDDIGLRSDGIFGVIFQDVTEQNFGSQVISTVDDSRITEDYFIQNQDNLVLKDANGLPSSPETGQLVYNDDTNDFVLNTSAGGDFDFDIASISDVNSAVKDPIYVDASNFSGTSGGDQIQAALDSLPDRGGVVFVPAEGPDSVGGESDVWELAFSLDVEEGEFLVGESQGGTVHGTTIMCTSSGSAIDIIGSSISGMTNVRVDGNATASNPVRLGTSGTDQDFLLRDVTVTDTLGNGVLIAGLENFFIENCTFQNNGDSSTDSGIVVSGTNPSNTLLVKNCVFQENKNGVFFNNSNPFKKAYVKDNEFDSTANSGIVINDSSPVQNSNFEDCSFTNVGSDAFQVNAELTRSKIEGFTVQGGGQTRHAISRVPGSGTLRNMKINDIISDELSISKFNNVVGASNGILHTVDGLGYNGSNDPRSAGDWNGNGREGVEVVWTDGNGNRRIAQYADGTWANQSLETGSTSNPTRSFGTWNEIDPDLTGFVSIEATVETDGTNPAKIVVDIDESGGTTADYTRTIANITGSPSGGTQVEGSNGFIYIPAGGQYQIRNVNDPNGGNSIDDVREGLV